MVLYLFTDPPLTPFLNGLFTRLDGAFPLFGTAAFALFCFYLIGPPGLLRGDALSVCCLAKGLPHAHGCRIRLFATCASQELHLGGAHAFCNYVAKHAHPYISGMHFLLKRVA